MAGKQHVTSHCIVTGTESLEGKTGNLEFRYRRVTDFHIHINKDNRLSGSDGPNEQS